MLNANLIEPMAFAASGTSIIRHFPLRELDIRVAGHEYFADTGATVQAVLTGGVDKWQRHFIDVHLRAQLPLVCQRCLRPVMFALDETVRVLLFADEAAANAADAEEDAEVLIVGESADVREWVEDGLLMALPLSPHHDNCGEYDLSDYYGSKPNPFAVLKDIATKN